MSQSSIKQNTIRRIETRLKIESTDLHIIVPRINYFNNRGGTVLIENLALKEPRTQPCFLPLLSAAVDYHGNLKLCCQIYDTALPQNYPYVIGNVGKNGFLNLWFSEKMNKYRDMTSNAQFEKLSVCQHCSFKQWFS